MWCRLAVRWPQSSPHPSNRSRRPAGDLCTPRQFRRRHRPFDKGGGPTGCVHPPGNGAVRPSRSTGPRPALGRASQRLLMLFILLEDYQFATGLYLCLIVCILPPALPLFSRVRPRCGTGGWRPWCARVCGVVARRWGAWRRTGGGGSALGCGRGGNDERTGGFRGVGAPAPEPLR